MSAFEAYKLYRGLKLHFSTENYNYFKYNGSTTNKFIPENQLLVFEKINKLYGKNLEEFYVANFLDNPNLWVNELLSEECFERFNCYKKRKESLSYSFKNDINKLLDQTNDLNDLLIVKKDFPLLMKETLRGKVNIETLLIMNSILKFFPMWDKYIEDELIWNSFKLKCKKYFPFIKFDFIKMKEILKEEVKNRAK